MVTGEDENGDHLIFMTSEVRRAEARHEAALQQLKYSRANWLEDSGGRARSAHQVQRCRAWRFLRATANRKPVPAANAKT